MRGRVLPRLGVSHPTLESRTTGSLVAARDGGEDRHRGRWLKKKDATGTGTEVSSPATGERLDVEGRIPKPRRIVNDEGERTQEDLMTHAQIFAGRHDEKMKSQTRRKSLRRLPRGGHQLSWV